MKSGFKITCVGAGYVGGPTMAVIADKCPEAIVYIYDFNKDLIEKWKSDQLPVFELGLHEIIKRTLGKNLFFTTSLEEAMENTNMVFLAVNTPTKRKGKGMNNACDTKYLENAMRDLCGYFSQKQLVEDLIIIEKSTVPVKTCEWIEKIFTENQSKFPSNKDKLVVLSNPEFLAEGSAIKDLLSPDRIIIGGRNNAKSDAAVEKLKQVYTHWVAEDKILTSGIFSSEMGKLVANSFLAQRISSINSISILCEKTGADVNQVATIVGTDSRIGNKFLKPSVGFGGSCLQKDVLHLIYLCRTLGLDEVADYWQGVISINELQKRRFSDMILTKLFHNLDEKAICIFGVAFKKNTQDCRGSAALQVVYNLLQEGAVLKIYDPKVQRSELVLQMKFMDRWEDHFDSKIHWCKDPYEASTKAHSIIVLTEWDEFVDFEYEKIHDLMSKPAFVFDGRNILNYEKMKKIGFETYLIGQSELA